MNTTTTTKQFKKIWKTLKQMLKDKELPSTSQITESKDKDYERCLVTPKAQLLLVNLPLLNSNNNFYVGVIDENMDEISSTEFSIISTEKEIKEALTKMYMTFYNTIS